MIHHSEISNSELKNKIRSKQIRYGGNANLKIYGHLDCKSGIRMKKSNRVFFSNMKEAIEAGYRPCGHCMRAEYKKWNNGII